MATEKKYLDLTGLGIYDAKIKAWVEAKKYQTEIEDLATIRTNAANAAGAWGVFLEGTDISKPSPKLSELATKNELSQAIIDLKNGASTGYDTLKGLETKIKEVATSVTDKNVTAEGESGDNALVNASATDNKVIVSATQKLQDAVTLAESALQKGDIVEGTTNGTISVGGESDIKVHGLGSAAFTDSTAYDAAGSAGTALANAKTYTDDEIKKLNATTLKMSAKANASSISDEITSLKNSVSGGTFFRGVFDSQDDVTDPKNGDIIVVGSLEYIYNGTTEAWIELGDSSANAQAITDLTNNKLDKTAQAADSAKLNGQAASYYATAQSVTDLQNSLVAITEAEINALFE